MGRGNWFPGRYTEDCRVLYVNYFTADEEAYDDDDATFAWDDFKYHLLSCLPASFIDTGDRYRLPSHLNSGGRDDVPLAYNGLFTLWINGQGDSDHCGIGLTVNDDAPAFAAAQLDAVADKLFARLNKSYECRVRCGAWMSAPYQPKENATPLLSH